ncbi:NUDIX hydrolase [Streptomyces sp. NBC_01485]|uniref:NUDIX hydrolase n=1 Tax=Streptomyces sp. NBC_01485 TaxID=2903884 RepID=UPI002E323C7F|nr:NUDIX hydrolase [Streptomyces sp. NBC_01485]
MSTPHDPDDISVTTTGTTDPTAGATTVQAAGCVLWRRSPAGGELEVCLVHRPKYDDWSHPKGKLKRGEEPLDGALREVEEETGYRAAPGARLPTVAYEANGRPKQVSYWAAEAVAGAFAPNDEVDRLLWLPPPAARDRLTQPRDRTLVDALLDVLHLA